MASESSPPPLFLSSLQFLDLSAWSLMPFLSSSRWLLFSFLLISPCLTVYVAATLAMNPLIPLICSDFLLLSTASVSLPNTPSFAQGLYCIKQNIYGFQIWQSKTPHPFVSSPDILLPTSRTILVYQLNRTWKPDSCPLLLTAISVDLLHNFPVPHALPRKTKAAAASTALDFCNSSSF